MTVSKEVPQIGKTTELAIVRMAIEGNARDIEIGIAMYLTGIVVDMARISVDMVGIAMDMVGIAVDTTGIEEIGRPAETSRTEGRIGILREKEVEIGTRIEIRGEGRGTLRTARDQGWRLRIANEELVTAPRNQVGQETRTTIETRRISENARDTEGNRGTCIIRTCIDLPFTAKKEG